MTEEQKKEADELYIKHFIIPYGDIVTSEYKDQLEALKAESKDTGANFKAVRFLNNQILELREQRTKLNERVETLKAGFKELYELATKTRKRSCTIDEASCLACDAKECQDSEAVKKAREVCGEQG